MDILYYLTYDLPVPYKKLKIYPATVKDYMLLNYYGQCLSLDKNSIPDVKIISMTELEFIFYSTETDFENKPYLLWLDRLLSICLKDEKDFESIGDSIKRYQYNEKKKPFFLINNERYFSKEFEDIKKIISIQNLIELPDQNISKEVRDALQKAKEYKDKLSGTKPASLEDYIVSLSSVTGWSLEYIYSLTIRKFTKLIQRLDNYIHYKIYLAASISGMVEFKDKSFIKHWLSNIDSEDKYQDVSMDLEKIQEKISFESAKK